MKVMVFVMVVVVMMITVLALEKICHELKTANTILRHQLLCVNTELNEARFGANVIANNDDKTCFYTGLPRFALFLTFSDIV